MPELLRMPEVATGTDEATLAGWPVAENQPFAAQDVIVNVETAKAAVDVEAETDGVILKTLVRPGTDVQVGDPIALIGRPGESVADLEAELARLGVGNGNGAAPAETSTEATVVDSPPAASQRVFASPLARRMAREASLEVATLTGSGPNGRIVRDDVVKAIAARNQSRPDRIAPPPSAVTEPAASPMWTEVPHSRLRRVIATRLTESKSTIPHFYLRGGVRADRLLALRAELNEVLPTRVSVSDLILKAVARAHTDVPDANVIWTDTGLRRYRAVDLGVAIASPRGLVTPVVTGVDRLGIGALAAATRDLARRAADGQLRQSELEGGTATVSNLGMFGTEEFAAIINPPQSSILAVGAARPEPDVTRHGKIRVRSKIHVVFSVDHRAIDGALAAHWMAAFRDAVETPLRLLG